MENIYNTIIGKNVLIFDTETSGLPFTKSFNSYYDPSDLEKYDGAILCQIAWVYIPNFNIDKLNDIHINCYICKPTDFLINNSHIHGITDDIAQQNGIPFSKILSCKNLKFDIDNADYIIAHNVLFDINILLSELFRHKYFNTYQKLFNKLNNKLNNNCICTCTIGKDICKIIYGKYYKLPKLQELYFHYYGVNPDPIIFKAHSADGDVKVLLSIFSKAFSLLSVK